MLNLSDLKTPGVYIDEVPKFPPSVAQVETAIPAFFGYTRITVLNGDSLVNRPIRITSLVEYESIYGARMETFTVAVNTNAAGQNVIVTGPAAPATIYRLYYSLQMYFANGGGPCYIVSLGPDSGPMSLANHIAGLAAIGKEDEPTLLVFPEAQALGQVDFYQLYQAALAQCNTLKDRFTICDVFNGNLDYTTPGPGNDIINDAAIGFRTLIGNNFLLYGAAYYPFLETSLTYNYDEAAVAITGTFNGVAAPANSVLRIAVPANAADEARSIYHAANQLYHQIRNAVNALPIVLPPSSTIAGVYATVDSNRGVWKSPANISLSFVRRPAVALDDKQQENLNLHVTGKSVNAIRPFTGKGILVWGARTLAGNDNEWRYISVRRFFNMVEESTKKASEQFVFEPNDANTWTKVRAMIENFLILQWRAGALAGAKTEHAFYVKVGLGQTMTAQDILEGRMIVEIGMAVVRPAEFIILRFSHKMQES
jgi:phage tail sheath protein FI